MSKTRRTFTLDLARSLPHGVIVTAFTTFSILIANQVFAAPTWTKSLLIAASPIGMLSGILAVTLVRRTGWSLNFAFALFCIFEGLAYLFAASSGWGESPRLIPYIAGMSFASFFTALSVPLLTQIYRHQYPDHRRGQLFSISAMARALSAIVAAFVLGHYLDADLQRYPSLLMLFALCAFAIAGCVLGMGKTVIPQAKKASLFEAFRHVSHDKPFLKLLGSWMILGFGNLLAFALFTESITNPEYGYAYSPEDATFITSFIPQVAFVFCVFPWGRLFDRWNFYLLRASINLVFIAGVVIYYCAGGWWGFVVGIALHGVARSGGNIAWSLWTTKFASPDRVADYMSVHTFCTGIRGTIAPFVALPLAAAFSLPLAGIISGSLMLIATLMIVPDIRLAHARRKSKMLQAPEH